MKKSILIGLLWLFGSAGVLADRDVNIVWDDIPCPASCGSVTGWKVEITTPSGVEVVDSKDLPDPLNTMYLAQGITLGFSEQVCARVLGYNNAGDGPWSAPGCATTSAQEVPGQTSLTVTIPNN